MSRHIFTRLRSAISLMVLLALAAALLPAHDAFAQDETVNLSKEQTNGTVYSWYIEQSHEDGKVLDLEKFMVIRLMNQTMRINDKDDTQYNFSDLMNKYYELLGPNGADLAYRATLPHDQVARTLFNAAVQTFPFDTVAEEVYREWGELDSSITSGINTEGRAVLRSVIDGYLLSDIKSSRLQEEIHYAIERAHTNSTFAEGWDEFVEEYISPDVKTHIGEFDAQEFIIENPNSGIPTTVLRSLGTDGSLQISVAALRNLAKEEFATINASIDDMQKTLVTISAQQGEIVDFMRNQELRQKAQALAEAKAKQYQLKLQAANSAVSIISTLVSFKNPKLGKQIAVIGQSAIKIGESLNGWMKAVSGLNGLSKIGSLSTIVMTGNVLGAVMNVVSLFGPQEPPIEQTILKEIGALRQQVNELRTEMHTRFDRVDKQLNTIYTTMHDRFNQIDIQLGKINGSVQEVQQSLLTLGLTLNRLERNNFEYLDALGRRPLREAMNGALGYQQRTGLDMPYQPEFVDYENAFHSWGTLNAFDALSAGPMERDYSDGAVLGELSATPLDANLNYLNGWLLAHGMAPFANKRLASPRDWAFASQSYAQLGLDWPEHLQRVDPQRQASLDAVGNDLQQAMQNISTIQTPSGPQGNGPLFTGLDDYYTSKLTGIDNGLLGSEAAFVNEVQASLNRQAPFALYGGLDQPLAAQPDDFKTTSCGGGASPASTFQTPHEIKNMIADYNRFALADYFQLAPIKVCVFAEWTSVDPPCPPVLCNRYGNYRVFIIVYSNNIQLARSELTDREIYEPDIWSKITPEWDRYWKRQFEQIFLNQTTPPPLTPEAVKQRDAITSALTSKLADLQHIHTGRVLNELNTGALRARAVELAGAKKLIESFITLGFPRAVEGDDFLRSLLFSNEALVDDQRITLAYVSPPPALSATAVISQAQLLINPRVELLKTAQKRREALAKVLTDYTGGISTEIYREDNSMIANARFEMVMAREFSDTEAPARRASRGSRGSSGLFTCR